MSFAGNMNVPGGGLAGGLGNLGSIAGLAGQAGGLAGMPGAGLIGGAASAMQLAQTGLSLLGKTPESIADAINSATGGRSLLTQDYRYITIETPLGKDVLLVSALVADEYVNQLPGIHLDLLSHRNNIAFEEIVGQRVKITLDPQSRNFTLAKIVTVPMPPASAGISMATSRRSGAWALPAQSRAMK